MSFNYCSIEGTIELPLGKVVKNYPSKKLSREESVKLFMFATCKVQLLFIAM